MGSGDDGANGQVAPPVVKEPYGIRYFVRCVFFIKFCRKLFLVESIFLHYTKSKEFFCFGKDRRMETRKFKDLTIRDAFMFAAVMSDPEICRRVLELTLGIPISEVHIQTEKTMAYHSEYHGVRLDVYAADADRTRFNVEMQVTLQRFLPKRSRYYHDQIDMDALLAGDSYENLPDTYVIFICDFDPFGDGLYRYSTGMVCEETGKSVSDGVKTVYLNAHGRNREDIPEELLQFLDYVKNIGRTEEISTTDPFVRHLQDSIDKIKQNRGMEERYMLLEEMMRNEKQKGIQEGSQKMLVQCIIESLESKFAIPVELRENIISETESDKLNAWFQLSLKASSLKEFEQNM